MATNNPEQKSALNVVLGAMTFGFEGKPGVRVHDLKQLEQIIDVFRAHGHAEIDNSRYYGDGSSEEIIGQVDWRTKGLIMSTKLPAFHVRSSVHSTTDGQLTFPNRITSSHSLKVVNLDNSAEHVMTEKYRKSPITMRYT
ncbi:hypothetical protein K435DRAFT_871943 [Dendrothele bispora CBS 962.96]|uniref:Uncharacterized protein n=1 Tax=Dendrothele bispora (strain CBS 962.96) TaxID=1314807 RepID=A0A4S8L468_DENBC|nr:hypothetical protein K435DRAFT_871943 [Dendrothele bispora CBS 962.96]